MKTTGAVLQLNCVPRPLGEALALLRVYDDGGRSCTSVRFAEVFVCSHLPVLVYVRTSPALCSKCNYMPTISTLSPTYGSRGDSRRLHVLCRLTAYSR